VEDLIAGGPFLTRVAILRERSDGGEPVAEAKKGVKEPFFARKEEGARGALEKMLHKGENI